MLGDSWFVLGLGKIASSSVANCQLGRDKRFLPWRRSRGDRHTKRLRFTSRESPSPGREPTPISRRTADVDRRSCSAYDGNPPPAPPARVRAAIHAVSVGLRLSATLHKSRTLLSRFLLHASSPSNSVSTAGDVPMPATRIRLRAVHFGAIRIVRSRGPPSLKLRRTGTRDPPVAALTRSPPNVRSVCRRLF